jgi:DNA-binding NtrC family response regulator
MNLELYPEAMTETGTLEQETNHYRVLVVDDEETMREFAVEALAHGGYQATAVDSGAAALMALRAEHYDLVLTDFNMPNGTGSDLIIKMHLEGCMMRVIMMTGAALTKELMTLMSMLHVGCVLQKPFGIDELIHAAERALQPTQEMPATMVHPEMVSGVEGDISNIPHKRRF